LKKIKLYKRIPLLLHYKENIYVLSSTLISLIMNKVNLMWIIFKKSQIKIYAFNQVNIKLMIKKECK